MGINSAKKGSSSPIARKAACADSRYPRRVSAPQRRGVNLEAAGSSSAFHAPATAKSRCNWSKSASKSKAFGRSGESTPKRATFSTTPERKAATEATGRSIDTPLKEGHVRGRKSFGVQRLHALEGATRSQSAMARWMMGGGSRNITALQTTTEVKTSTRAAGVGKTATWHRRSGEWNWTAKRSGKWGCDGTGWKEAAKLFADTISAIAGDH